jgi:protocatechuate 4,5-dioxygenase beta chain
MAKLAAVLATTHHLLFYKTSQLPPDAAPPFAAEWVAKVTSYRQMLTRARLVPQEANRD